MAGGSGTRLEALTRWDCKPALPFAGQYRNIDFALSNCVNSGIRRIGVLTQYKAHSLIQHIRQGWGCLRPEWGEFIELWPAQQQLGASWYRGTADAVYQNIHLIRSHAPESVLVLAGDHVYKMDYSAMIELHDRRGADVTVGCVEVPIEQARNFGVLGIDSQGWIRTFAEKPACPAPMPGRTHHALASMGIYVFRRDFLFHCLAVDACDPNAAHDFGHSILPAAIGRRARVAAHSFRDPRTGRQGYWRDVGTVDSYWQANMDLLAPRPDLDLNDERWPIWTYHDQLPPPRFTGSGVARESVVCGGSVVAGDVRHSVLSTSCEIGAGSVVEDAVILPNVTIGKDCQINRAIVDTGCVIPDGTVIGTDLFAAPGLYVSPNGIVLFASPETVDHGARASSASKVA